MLNVQALTSTLSAMSLPQLQQYASLHKDDPYVVTMALSIANQKKQMQTAAQGQAGQQPMPKVVDQEISQMAPRPMPTPMQRPTPMPEEVGIGQLPAQNIAKMAGGGIVAFGDGGEIPRYQFGGSINPNAGFIEFLKQLGVSAQEFVNATPQAQKNLRDMFSSAAPEAGAAPASPATPATPTPAATSPSTSASLSSTLGKYAGALKSGLGGLNVLGLGYQLFGTSPEEMATLKKADAARLGKATGETLKNLGLPEGSSAAPMSSADVDALISYNPAANPTANLAANTTANPTAKPPAKLPGTGASTAGGLSNLITDPAGMQKALADMQKDISPQVPQVISQGIKDIQTAEEAQANANVKAIEDEQKARGPALKEFEARLKEKEGRLTKQEELQGPLALLNAGLAIMSGTSPFAFANIGAGAQVGLKSYVAGAEKIEAARDKLAESYGKIDEVRRNEGRMDAKELRDARNAALKPAIEAKKLTVSALEKDWGLSRQEAAKGLEAIMANQREIFAQGEATKRAHIQASAHDPLALYRALGRGDTDITKGVEVATKLKTEPKSEQDFRQDWAKSLVLQQRYPDVNDFVRMMKGTAAMQSGAQLNASDAALINKYLKQ